MRARWALLLALGAGCGPGDGSIILRFPSEAARQATKKIELYALGAAERIDRPSCDALLAKLPREEPLGVDLVTEPFPLPKEGAYTITGFPAGAPVVLVVGLDAEDNRLFQGCSDRFGLELGNRDVDIVLSAILPAAVFLERVSGGHQVGGAGELLAEPLRARALAVSAHARAAPYVLPGLAVELSTDLPGVELAGQPAPVTLLTDVDGVVSAELRLPPRLGGGAVLMRSPALQAACAAGGGPSAARECPGQTSQRYLFSAVAELGPLTRGALVAEPAEIDALVEVAIGDVVQGSGLDAVILGCRGDPAACRAGTGGATQLFTIASIAGASAAATLIPGPLGVAPGALYVGPFFPGGQDSVVVLNRRRADCQSRVDPNTHEATPCQGSEALAFASDGQSLAAPLRSTLTASNAVGLAPWSSGGSLRLLTAGQGAGTFPRPCSDAPMCRAEHEYVCADGRSDCTSYCFSRQNVDDTAARQEFAATCVDLCQARPEGCGCPPGESCLPHPYDSALGLRCIPEDKLIDQLQAGPSGLENVEGCQERRAECLKDKQSPSRCACLDRARGNRCTGQDACGCAVPQQILIGGGALPRDLALAEGSAGPDLVVASNSGLELMPGTPAGSFRWELRRSPSPSTDGVRWIDLDGQGAADLLWWSRQPCGEDSPSCPLSRRLSAEGTLDGRAVPGCAGVLLRDAPRPIGTVAEDGCRRFSLPFVPDGSCSADLNGDGRLDVVFSSFEADEVLVFLGDGQGGLRDPPTKVALPGGTQGGRLVCRDIDGDRAADLVVAGPKGRLITLLQK